MTRDDVMALTGRELNAAVLIEYYGWAWMQRISDNDGLPKCALIPPEKGEWERVNWYGPHWIHADFWPEEHERFVDWHSQGMLRVGKQMILGMMRPTTDANVIKGVEAEIERRGLWQEYVIELAYLLKILDVGVAFLFSEKECFAMITAPLETKCRAALMAVLTEKG